MRLSLAGAEIEYRPALYTPEKAAALYQSLLRPSELAWRCDAIELFGRQVRQPRLTVWVADAAITYSYSGITMSPQPWTPVLSDIRRKLETHVGCKFNSVLINQYRDGSDYMGWHRDNERELGLQPVIATLSLGATRSFDLRHMEYRDNGLPIQRFELQSGDLIIMRGATQQHWKHRVPKQRQADRPRINLSFRVTAPRTPHS